MQMTGRQALLEIFRSEGVQHIFGIPGATEILFMDALEDCPDIRYVLGLHEVVAAGMAEGYARTSGQVGVLNLHTGTGLAAALPMLSNAYQGGVPLVITAGQQDTRLLAYEPALAGELVRLAGPFTKWATEIIHAEDIPTVFRRAFQVAAHPPTGPVFVSLPQNILDSRLNCEYVQGAPSHTRIHPDPESVEVAADLLAGAKNPAIIVEHGVAKSEAVAEVVRFAEVIGARVYECWMSDVNFPVDHGLYAGDLDLASLRTREILAKVDVLVAIGAELFSQPIYLDGALLSPTTQLVQIDNRAWQIGKNFSVASGIEGDIRVAVGDLTSALIRKMSPGERERAQVRARVAGEEKQKAEKTLAEEALRQKDRLPISATRLMQEIRDTLEVGTRIVDDCWSCSAILRRTLQFNEAKSYQRARGGGSIGWGLPGALGVKLASPDRPVVCISGDGSAMWSIQSFWTAAHYHIPVTYIICANACYQQVRNMKTLIMGEKARGRKLGTCLDHPRNDFCKIAEGMGLPAQRVERPEELRSALQRAFSSGKPNLVEVYMDSAPAARKD
ncbi:MAG TPA: thiamine pyrophosphate-binding protein [Candidatus Methylomirabilis sp.]|nr:thiamine pyrophosphate-binding protein [Candidatus Methylomirabilis sp.]